MSSTEKIELTIHDLSTSGDGIAKYKGAVYFVKEATIGDTVLARVLQKNNNYYIAQTEQYLKKSDSRRQPPCSHFGICGSCQIQNLEYEAQLKYKENQIKETLQRIGGFKELPLKKIVAADNEFFYRNKAQLPLGFQQEITMGYYRQNSHEIIDLQQCFLQQKITVETALAFKQFFKEQRFSIYNEQKHNGLLRHLIIRESHHKKELLIGLAVTSAKIPQQEKLLTFIENLNRARQEYRITSLVLNINSDKTNRITGPKNITILGSGFIEEQFGPYSFNVYLDTFLQINTSQAEKAYQQIASYIKPGTKLTTDIYCGIGTIALYAAQNSQQVIGIENNEASIAAANENCQKNKINNCRFICSSAEKTDPKILNQADVFIVDPPRKGLDEKVIELILANQPQQLIYLSCNPATLARDLSQLCANNLYHLEEVTPFDFFPQTSHVETLVHLQKK